MDKIKTNFRNPFSDKLAEFELGFIDYFANSDLVDIDVAIHDEDGSFTEQSTMLEVCTQLVSEAFTQGYNEGARYGYQFGASYIALLVAAFANWLDDKGVDYNKEELNDVVHIASEEAKIRNDKDNE